MSWDPDRFESLVSRMSLTLEGKRPMLDSNVYIFRYPAEMELRCVSEFTRLIKRLESKNLRSEIIWINKLFVSALQRVDSIESLSIAEKRDRHLIFNGLSNVAVGLTVLMANEISEILKDKQMPYCAVMLRVGSALPFLNLSSILSLLENKIKCMLILTCPEKDGKIIGTNYTSSNIYPRGEVV